MVTHAHSRSPTHLTPDMSFLSARGRHLKEWLLKMSATRSLEGWDQIHNGKETRTDESQELTQSTEDRQTL